MPQPANPSSSRFTLDTLPLKLLKDIADSNVDPEQVAHSYFRFDLIASSLRLNITYLDATRLGPFGLPIDTISSLLHLPNLTSAALKGPRSPYPAIDSGEFGVNENPASLDTYRSAHKAPKAVSRRLTKVSLKTYSFTGVLATLRQFSDEMQLNYKLHRLTLFDQSLSPGRSTFIPHEDWYQLRLPHLDYLALLVAANPQEVLRWIVQVAPQTWELHLTHWKYKGITSEDGKPIPIDLPQLKHLTLVGEISLPGQLRKTLSSLKRSVPKPLSLPPFAPYTSTSLPRSSPPITTLFAHPAPNEESQSQ
ncbi:hypothetical protein JCM11641_003484 [Rhodosporidiobolus odoratus]